MARVVRRLGPVVVLVALLIGSLAAAAGARTLTPNSPVSRGSGYLALGDSVTFGYQEPQVVPAPNYKVAADFRGYPLQVGSVLHLKVADLACPGETAGSLINVRSPSNGCENGYRQSFPLHVRYSGSQLQAAVRYLHAHPGVRLVSLMIGANDLFRCQAQTSDGCAKELPAALAAVRRHVHTILATVRGAGRYHGQIVVVRYYSLNNASAAITSFSKQLNAAQAAGARPFHVRFADGFGEFARASQRFGSNPCLGGLLTQIGSYGDCGVHPSYAGQALLAKAVIAATRLR